MTTLTDDQFRELLKTFRVEAADHIQTLNQVLLQLERATDEKRRQELLMGAFRAAHSLKGASRAVGLNDIAALSHSLESVLHQARIGRLALDPATCDILYGVLDTIKQLLDGQDVPLELVHHQLAELVSGIESQDSPAQEMLEEIQANSQSLVVQDAPPENLPETLHEELDIVDTVMPVAPGEDTIRVAVGKLDNLMAQSGELLISKISAEQHLAEMEAIQRQLTRWSRTWRDLKTLLPRVNNGVERQLTDILTRHNEHQQELAKDINTLRQSLNRDTLRLGMVATRVQDEVRRVRMVPFQTLGLTFQRVVRDAARSEGKRVAPLRIEGGEVELDKKVLETLKDPLIHLLRNAVGHGIEPAQGRLAAGKSSEAQITLFVQQRSGEVRIAVRDDGQGFDLVALRQGSVERGGPILDERASADDVIQLAFLPGMTTARQVTSLAGRGVGLDVVRQCLETLQGRILVESVPGQGSTIQLLVPVSLAMTRGLLIRVGVDLYILPLLSVEKIIEPRDTFSVEGRSVLSVDGAPIPLVPLASLLRRSAPASNAPTKALAVIVRVAEQRLAILVDDVLTEQEVAVKPLSKLVKQVPNVAGAALLGNGEPVIVLNVADLIRSARSSSSYSLPAIPSEVQSNTTDHAVNGAKSAIHILIVDDSITTRTLEKNILQAAGYQVTTATDGTLALRQLKEQAIDLVVSDVQMPNMDGFALTRYIRESVDYNNIPVILVTSLESHEDRERGMLAGANAYIVKRGFDQAELLSTIQNLI